jgi:hypothetical protein
MSAQHTPGPWHLRLSNNATPHIEHGDCFRDEVGELDNRICVMPAEIVQSFNSFANARLIAAAPDLLEALQAALEALRGSAGFDEINNAKKQIKAAIDKATGEQA